jgi:3-oxoadipate enol-lactonase
LLARVVRPALVIAAEEDVLVPLAESETIRSLLPRSQLVVLPNAGHLSNVEVPDEFSAVVDDFLHSNF